MKTLLYLVRLLKWYAFLMKVYSVVPNKIMYHWCVNVHGKIEEIKKQNPGMDVVIRNMEKIRQSIRSQFNAASLLMMNRKDARKHLESLVVERNNANVIFRVEYEMVIRKTVKELQGCGFVFLVSMKGENWIVLK